MDHNVAPVRIGYKYRQYFTHTIGGCLNDDKSAQAFQPPGSRNERIIEDEPRGLCSYDYNSLSNLHLLPFTYETISSYLPLYENNLPDDIFGQIF